MNSPIKHNLVFQANDVYRNYLLHTYIVTSKPKRISVAEGLVHITNLLSSRFNVIIRSGINFDKSIGLLKGNENA